MLEVHKTIAVNSKEYVADILCNSLYRNKIFLFFFLIFTIFFLSN